jgi:hypothetical protein
MQAVYVPQEARDFRIDEEKRLEYKLECKSETIMVTKELNTEFHDSPCNMLLINSSIQRFKIYITGNLAFYALMLGKPNSANNWYIWCDCKKKWYGHPADIADNAVKWTSERLKQAKWLFNG